MYIRSWPLLSGDLDIDLTPAVFYIGIHFNYNHAHAPEHGVWFYRFKFVCIVKTEVYVMY